MFDERKNVVCCIDRSQGGRNKARALVVMGIEYSSSRKGFSSVLVHKSNSTADKQEHNQARTKNSLVLSNNSIQFENKSCRS
jgi:hypothetical protein